MIWYPYQQMKTMKEPYKIVDAKGVYLYTKDHKMIDSVSSWWSVIHGYKNPVLNQAIKEQVDNFSHVMLGGLTHEPVCQLSQKLQEWLPGVKLLFLFRFGKCCCRGGTKNGFAVLYQSRETKKYGIIFGTCLSWGYL